MPGDPAPAPAPATPRLRFRFRLQESGAQCVDVVECVATRRLLVDKHARVTERAAADAALRELDLLLTLQARQREPGGAARRHLRKHVVQLAGYRLEGERLHVLQEFCARGDLLRAIEREERLVRAGLLAPADGRTTSVHGVRALFRQTLRGVAALHAIGVAHLDLSLENVLLTDAGTVKVADFGHALHVHGDKVRVSVAKDAYAAPEMIDAQDGPAPPAVDAFKCDAWALGVILFKLCTKRELLVRADGSDPFFADLRSSGTRRALQRRIAREAASPLPSGSCSLLAADAQAPPALVDLLSRLLDVDPTSRLSVAAALQHPFLSDEVARQVAAASSPSVSAARRRPAACKSAVARPSASKPACGARSSRLALKLGAAPHGRDRTHSAEIALEDTRVNMRRPSALPRSPLPPCTA